MPAKGGGSALRGRDTEGAEYDGPESMWAAELEGANGAGKSEWYSKGIQYWAALPATVETVLGGYQRVSPSDVRESDAFLRSVFPAVEDAAGARRPLVAADCGAGVGRVTQNLLLRHFDEVDVFEPVKHFLDTAEANIGRAPGGGADGDAPRTVNFVCEPLEEFTPTRGRYDVIWAQWCLGHLTDDDFVRFFTRCKAGLKRDGLIVVKENNCAEGFVVDKEDSSLTRSNTYFLSLFAKAKLKLVKTKLQKGFPAELFAVRMYALQPE